MAEETFLLWLTLGILAALSVMNAVVLIGLVRIVAQLYQAVLPNSNPLDGGVRKEAPAFIAKSMTGSVVDSAGFRGRLTALLFISPTCASCVATLEQLAIVGARAAGNVVLVCDGTSEECEALADRFAPIELIHDDDRRIRRLYGVTRYPMSVLIGVDGRIRSYGQPAAEDIRAVVDQVDDGARSGPNLNNVVVGTEP